MEIKFNIEKRNKKNNTIQPPRKRIETSKKLAWASVICFVIAIVYSVLIFTYSVIANKICDFTMLITLITVTGAAFGTTTAFYYNKSRFENIIKLQKSSLKSKYLILKDVNVLDDTRVQIELENELAKIESDIDNEKTMSNQEITYNG